MFPLTKFDSIRLWKTVKNFLKTIKKSNPFISLWFYPKSVCVCLHTLHTKWRDFFQSNNFQLNFFFHLVISHSWNIYPFHYLVDWILTCLTFARVCVSKCLFVFKIQTFFLDKIYPMAFSNDGGGGGFRVSKELTLSAFCLPFLSGYFNSIWINFHLNGKKYPKIHYHHHHHRGKINGQNWKPLVHLRIT